MFQLVYLMKRISSQMMMKSCSGCTEYKEEDSEDTEDDHANEKDKSSKSKTGKSRSQKVFKPAVKGTSLITTVYD